MTHMPHLDSLRALAVLRVIMHHYAPQYRIPGSLGVQLFFVLSGFLITGILLRDKTRIDSGSVSIIGSLKRFYWRRTLRIFPLYYAMIAIGCALALPGFRDSVWHLLVYLGNAPSVLNDGFRASGHFWSLAVEEQFYLAWPLLLFVVPRKRLMAVFIVAIIIGISTRWLLLSGGDTVEKFLTPASLDYLAYGALLASHHEKPNPVCSFVISRPFFCAALIAVVFYGIGWMQNVLIFRAVTGVLFMNVVHIGSIGFTGVLKCVFDSKIMQYIGQISYGVYVYHVPAVVAVSMYIWPISNEKTWLLFLLKTALTFAIAIPSYHLFEKPINDLKDRKVTKEPTLGISQHIHDTA